LLRLVSLKKRSDFLELRGKEVSFSKYFILQYHPTPLDDIFFYGLVVSKKNGNAVRRNKAKRRMRSLFLELVLSGHILKSARVVMIAKRRLIDGDYMDILREFKKAIEEAQGS
jgi:ribonuclease P protein component